MASLDLNVASIAGITVGFLGLAFVLQILYNLFLHPLRSYPGPLLFRATRLGYVHKLVTGKMPFEVLDLVNKYGPVVRIAPNELAYADPDAWKDIYGHRTGSLLGAEEMPKYGTFYRTRGVAPTIISETRENHTMLRKSLANGFSDRAMRDQEPLIGRYVDLLIQRLREHSTEEVYSDDKTERPETVPKVMDIKTWYNWTTFDIIGDLAFGESFGCLENVYYHPWVDVIAHTIQGGALFQAIKLMGFDGVLLPVLRAVMRGRKKHMSMTKDMLKRRMAADVERPDLIDGLLKKKDEWNIEMPRLLGNASVLVIAGSETTATLLAGVTYLLLTHPEAMKKVVDEVRSSFRSEEEITLTSVGNLTYMLACLNEALRRYPPVAIGMPREVPAGGANIAGKFVPEKTAVACWHWAMYHSASNFEDPFAFKPERFLEGSKNSHDRLDALQPFSIGPRNCIGRNLAYAEMRLILARILFNFDMELVDPNDQWMDQKVYTLWAKPSLNVYLRPVR